MTDGPLISIMMPCYNGARTLPLALASLLAQRWTRWECVLIDDGSEDHPEVIVERADDPRIRLTRLPRNVGRGAARQIALEEARGDMLAFLDADDWIPPDKLDTQIAILRAHPEVSLVSMGLAVVDELGALAGVRRLTPHGAGVAICGPITTPRPLAFAFASSMIRMEVARKGRFDPTLRLAQDTDFLLQILLGRRFALTSQLGYVYTEITSRTPKKIIAGYRFSQQIFAKYRRSHPLSSRLEIARYKGKELALRAADLVGQGRLLHTRPLPPPEYDELEHFWSACRAVAPLRRRLEGLPPSRSGALLSSLDPSTDLDDLTQTPTQRIP